MADDLVFPTVLMDVACELMDRWSRALDLPRI